MSSTFLAMRCMSPRPASGMTTRRLLKGFGDASVLEVIESQAGNAYRAGVYRALCRRCGRVARVPEKIEVRDRDPETRYGSDRDSLEEGYRIDEREQAMKIRTDKSVSHQRGTTNVYADLGYKSADEMLVKAQLVTTIAEILTERGYTQTKAAALLGIPQPKLSKMLRGQFRGFSERKLMDCLTLLGRDIDIVVRTTPKRKGQGAVSVSFA